MRSIRRFAAGTMMLVTAACASLGPSTDGTAGAVSWRAIDIETARAAATATYRYTLVLKETKGVEIVYWGIRIEPRRTSPTVTPSRSVQTGSWTLPANGELKLRMTGGCEATGSGSCDRADLAIVLLGTDARGESMRTEIHVAFPLR